MCLAVPGKILEITGDDVLSRSGKVDFSGVVREVSLGLVPEAGVGDYVIVHAGCAISQLDEEEALLTLQDLKTLEDLYADEDRASLS